MPLQTVWLGPLYRCLDDSYAEQSRIQSIEKPLIVSAYKVCLSVLLCVCVTGVRAADRWRSRVHRVLPGHVSADHEQAQGLRAAGAADGLEPGAGGELRREQRLPDRVESGGLAATSLPGVRAAHAHDRHAHRHRPWRLQLHDGHHALPRANLHGGGRAHQCGTSRTAHVRPDRRAARHVQARAHQALRHPQSQVLGPTPTSKLRSSTDESQDFVLLFFFRFVFQYIKIKIKPNDQTIVYHK